MNECLDVYYGYMLTYVDMIISTINFIVWIVSCASNLNNFLEVIYWHSLKHCYQGCCLFCENKHDGLIYMHIIVKLIGINIFEFVWTLKWGILSLVF